MANGKTASSARRREVRRTVPKPNPTWLELIRRREVVWAMLFIVLFTVFGSLLALAEAPRYQVDQVLRYPLVSRVAFEVEDTEKTLLQRERAREGELNVFRPNFEYWERLVRITDSLLVLAEPEASQTDREQVGLDNERALRELQKYTAEDGPRQWQALRDQFLLELFTTVYILEHEHTQPEIESIYNRRNILVIQPQSADGQLREAPTLVGPTSYFSVEEPVRFRGRLVQAVRNFPRDLQDLIVNLVLNNLHPTYMLDEELTEQRLQAAYDSPENIVMETVEMSQVLAPAGTALTSADLLLIQHEKEAFRRDQQSARDRILATSATVGIILLLAIGLWVYLFAYNHKIVRNPVRGFALISVLLACQALAVFLVSIDLRFLYASATLPTIFAAILLTIVYDQRFALAMGALHAVLIMVSLNVPMEFGLVLMTGVAVSVIQLREVRTRSKLVIVGGWTGAGMAAATAMTALAFRPLHHELAYTTILYDAICALASGFAAGILVQGMLPFIERLFKVTTAMTLRELNDASHPLLQRLAQEAPGTYQHSLRMADMAEAAAEAIDADGLLCRVGAMYHDIGKINKPLYFIENQGGGPNRHAKLSPAMSLLIIVGHVKDGVEMAREYSLPSLIRHFIESHHGTTLVEYFYHAARKQTEAEDKPGPSEFEFRYPGPKPQTKEAGIMLLCDGIEAAARTLPEPTPVRLEQLVHAIANKRLMDGQFNECNLTLAELHRIEQAITKMLCAVYHGRIKYPTEKPAAQPAAPQPRPQAAV